jgi:hypothetical protein
VGAGLAIAGLVILSVSFRVEKRARVSLSGTPTAPTPTVSAV